MDAAASLTETLAAFTCGMEPSLLPPSVTTDATFRLIDSVGVGLAASQSDYARMVRRVATQLGGPAEATTIGISDRMPAPACLAGSVQCHTAQSRPSTAHMYQASGPESVDRRQRKPWTST